jgi:hypothetical protein
MDTFTKPFNITTVARGDLQGRGMTDKQIASITDAQMAAIGRTMGRILGDTGAFLDALDAAAESVLES